ncbi:MAG: PHP domain-containing protein [Bacteroidales bacterium]
MNKTDCRIPQDLHIHTTFSHLDSAVAEAQTPEFIARIDHAKIRGISDHFEHFYERFEEYYITLKQYGFYVGTEVDGSEYTWKAANLDFEYYIYHCRNHPVEYRGIETLLETGKPVIIAHPMVLDTDLNRVPPECYIEINNRYVWQNDWKKRLAPFTGRFRFVIGSDAHQPNWLNQNVARYVAGKLNIQETCLFERSFSGLSE